MHTCSTSWLCPVCTAQLVELRRSEISAAHLAFQEATARFKQRPSLVHGVDPVHRAVNEGQGEARELLHFHRFLQHCQALKRYLSQLVSPRRALRGNGQDHSNALPEHVEKLIKIDGPQRFGRSFSHGSSSLGELPSVPTEEPPC